MLIGVTLFVLVDLPRRLVHRLAHLSLRHRRAPVTVRSRTLGGTLAGGAARLARWLLDR